jgi:hypothetical protein
MKFGRSYFMNIEGTSGRPHTFQYPQADGANAGLTVAFDIARTNLANLADAHFSIYNMAAATRNDLFYDPLPSDGNIFMQAGYASQLGLSTIFDGEIYGSYPERRGQDVIMQITASEGLLATTDLQIPAGVVFASGTYLNQKVQTIASLFSKYGIQIGSINLSVNDNYQSLIESPSGLAWDWLQKNLPPGGKLFIDLGKIYFLSREFTGPPSSGIALITDDMGIIGIPRRTQWSTSLTMVFEPSFAIGQPVGLLSALNSYASLPYPGYEIIGIHHYGTISPVESGQVYTDLELQLTNAPLEPVDAPLILA